MDITYSLCEMLSVQFYCHFLRDISADIHEVSAFRFPDTPFMTPGILMQKNGLLAIRVIKALT